MADQTKIQEICEYLDAYYMHISDSACKINMNLNQDRSWMGSRAPREGRGKPFRFWTNRDTLFFGVMVNIVNILVKWVRLEGLISVVDLSRFFLFEPVLMILQSGG